jgi:hypothetical protein
LIGEADAAHLLKLTLMLRATHAHGEIYLRYSLDRDGRISRLVWWHL